MLPRRVRIGARMYRIKRLTPAAARAEALHGDCDTDTKTIRIATHYGRENSAATLLHEILHGIFHEYHVRAGNEESVVRGFESGLLQVIKDNKKVWKYITG